jgi:catechol 2,3-dioxygenase-like lactoylglutathione lyase family enzyme
VDAITIHHVGVEVDDLEEAERFYAGTLGLPIRTDRPADVPPGIWLDVGDRRLSIQPRGDVPGAAHFAIVVDDVEGAAEHLRAQGVDVREMNPPYLNAMFQDPWGNWIELRRPPEVWAAKFAK